MKCKVCGGEIQMQYSQIFHVCEKKLNDLYKLQYNLIQLIYKMMKIEIFKLFNILHEPEELVLLIEIVYNEYDTIESFKYFSENN